MISPTPSPIPSPSAAGVDIGKIADDAQTALSLTQSISNNQGPIALFLGIAVAMIAIAYIFYRISQKAEAEASKAKTDLQVEKNNETFEDLDVPDLIARDVKSRGDRGSGNSGQ